MKQLLATLALLLLIPAAATAQDFESLFNGTDLSGWAGKPEFWSVKDGAIFGQTTEENPTEGNTFLVWQGGEVATSCSKRRSASQVTTREFNTAVNWSANLKTSS